MTVKLIAVREMYYASKTRWPGDEFEASEQDAHILCAPDLPGGQKARRADEPDKAAARPARAPEAPAAAPAAHPPENAPAASAGAARGHPVEPMSTETTSPLRRYPRRRNHEG